MSPANTELGQPHARTSTGERPLPYPPQRQPSHGKKEQATTVTTEGNQRPSRDIGSGAASRALAAVIRPAATAAPWILTPICVLSALSSIALIPLAALNDLWFLTLFEATSLLAAIVGLLTLRGRFAQGPALSLVFTGGAIASLAVLAEPITVARFLGTQGNPIVLAGFEILPLMAARVLAGVIIGLGAVTIAWARRPQRSAGYLLRSAAAAVPAILIAVPIAWPGAAQTRPGWRAPLDIAAKGFDALPLPVQLIAMIAAFFIVLALVSAAGHCLIRSFEVARIDPAPPDSQPAHANAPNPAGA